MTDPNTEAGMSAEAVVAAVVVIVMILVFIQQSGMLSGPEGRQLGPGFRTASAETNP